MGRWTRISAGACGKCITCSPMWCDVRKHKQSSVNISIWWDPRGTHGLCIIFFSFWKDHDWNKTDIQKSRACFLCGIDVSFSNSSSVEIESHQIDVTSVTATTCSRRKTLWLIKTMWWSQLMIKSLDERVWFNQLPTREFTNPSSCHYDGGGVYVKGFTQAWNQQIRLALRYDRLAWCAVIRSWWRH